MAFDPFADEPRKIVRGHEIGQDLSLLSIDELDERVETAGARDRPPQGSEGRQGKLPCGRERLLQAGAGLTRV